MDAAAIAQFIRASFPGVADVVADETHFFYYDPGGDVPSDRRLPFATLVSSDAYDTFSQLDRPGVFRLNIGISPETFRALFPAEPDEDEAGHDFTALDRIMPHPVYGRMFWVAVLNPGETTFQEVVPLLAEAHDRAVTRLGRLRPVAEDG